MLSWGSYIQILSGVSFFHGLCKRDGVTKTWLGTISSSGVVEAIYDYWAYFEPIRVYGNQKCIKNTQLITNSMDNIVIGQQNNTALVQELKTAWGFPNITYSNDFMAIIVSGLWEWQSKNWDPELAGTPYFEYYCGNITTQKLLYPSLNSSTAEVQKLLTKGGYGSQLGSLTIPYLNWIGWLTGKNFSSSQISTLHLHRTTDSDQTTPTPTTATVLLTRTPAIQPTTLPTTPKTMPPRIGAYGPTNTAPNGATSKTAAPSPPINFRSSPAQSTSPTPQSSAPHPSTSLHPPTFNASTATEVSTSPTPVSHT